MRTKTLFIALAVTLACSAKDIKTVVLNTAPEMHCSSCENKIKSNIRFEKGVKDIVTNLADKTVTVTYDADKTDVDKIIEGFKKIDYVATIATPQQRVLPRQDRRRVAAAAVMVASAVQLKSQNMPKLSLQRRKDVVAVQRKQIRKQQPTMVL